MAARGGEPATSAQVTHYTVVRDWHDGDGDAAVIAVKADLSLDDPYADAEHGPSAPAMSTGRTGWPATRSRTPPFLVLVAFIDLSEHVEISVLRA